MTSDELIGWLTFVVVTLTLGVLIWYTIETRRIANQTVTSNLRPIILYVGWIKDWSIQSKWQNLVILSIQFQNQKNIATSIRGHVVIDEKKYDLLFANPVTEEIEDNQKKTSYLPVWAFLPASATLSIAYISDKYIAVNGKNEIYIEYQDIEGNNYFTKIDELFSVITGKCKRKVF